MSKTPKRKNPYSNLHIKIPTSDPDYYKAWRAIHHYSGKRFSVEEYNKQRRWDIRFRKKYIFEYNDEFYMTPKIAAEQLPIKYDTLLCYVKWSIIPKPIYYRKDVKFHSNFGNGEYVRYFSQTQVELMRKMFSKTKKRKITRQEASDFLYANWEKYEKNLGDFSKNGDNNGK